MQAGIEIKYILLFAILIALTGFSFESQSNDASIQKNTAPVASVTSKN